MTIKLSDARLAEPALALVTDFVAAHLGLNFRKRGRDLERGIRTAVAEWEHGDVLAYIQKLLANGAGSNELELLAHHLTVGETYFFRDRRVLETISERIVPEFALAQRCDNNRLRIWSAGCSTGEEPYSIAIAIERVRPRIGGMSVEVYGTDLNRHSLRKASEGMYGEWSFRDTPSWVKGTYFKPVRDRQWSILPSIKAKVALSRLNLMEDSPSWLPGATDTVDIIFCRNVLMYFTPEAIRQVVRRFYLLLPPNGWLVVGPAETFRDFFPEFVPVSLNGVTLYKKPAAPLQVRVTLDIGLDERMSSSLESTVASPRLTVEQGCEGAEPTVERRLSPTAQPSVSNPQELQEPTAALVLARTCANEGRLAEALSWCETAIAADKMAATAHYIKAMVLEEQGLQQEALLSLRRAIYADPKFVLGHFALGNLSLKHGKFKQAQKHFENVWLLLAQYKPEDILPESDGLSAGMLRAMLTQDVRSSHQVSHRQPAPVIPQ